MTYLIKFNEDGRRGETYLIESEEQVQELLNKGFEIIEEDIYQLLLGNVDGQEHVKYVTEDSDTGELMVSYEPYVPPAPSLDELKTAKLTSLKSMRDTLEVEPIEYNGNSFDYDEKARDRINAAIIALDMQSQLTGTEASLSWTTADNTEATVTANDLRGVIANVAVRSNALHVKYRELKELVENALTKEELDAIVLDAL